MTGNIDVEDPQLDVNYKISSSSPCLDAGIDVGLTSDYWGNAVPYNGLPDIGVYEWRQAGGGGVTQPAVPGLVSPADGATGLSATVVLTWSVSTDAVEYQVQVSSDPQFGSTLIDMRSIKGTTFTAGPLPYGATFHWRVRASNANGTSPYSVARTFSIEAQPIQLRGHDISTEGVPVAFITNPRGSGSRSLEVIRDGVMPPVGSNDPSLAYDTFTGGQRSFDWIGYTFSSPHVFSRLLFQEGIRYRDQGGWFADLKVQVRASGQWNDVQGFASNPSYPATGGDSYVMYGLEFPPVVGDGIRIAGTPGGLAQFVSCAELRAFDTTANALSSPRVEYPIANTSPVLTLLNVRWTAVSGAITYHLQISSDAAFGTLVVNDSSLTDTLRSVGPLAHATTYFCRVRARSGTFISTFSQVVSFTTVDALTVLPSPQIVYPVTGSGNLPISLTIRWTRSSGAARFRLQLASDPAFATVVLDDTALTDTVRPVGPLAYGSVFFCRVRAQSGAFVSSFSPVIGFATADYYTITPFAAPVLASPENGATVEPPTVALYWKGVQNATRYHVQVSEEDAFVRLAIDTTISDVSIRVFAPKTRTNYYWRVQARDGEDVHDYSEVRRFLTLGPRSTEMEQNYPNPFNPSTIITYYVEREGAVLLKVFNILGQEVATIVDAVQSAGFHRIVFDIGALGRGKGVASGVYFCRLTTGNYVETRKMLLRK
jgi:hypothetical protein